MIYLDNNATTPLDPRVAEVMIQCYQTIYGNPSSIHRLGQEARKLIVKARDQIAAYLGQDPEEIIFHSGGTEGINHILRSLFQDKQGHIITSSVEHSAVFETVKSLGVPVTFLNPGLWGAVTAEQVLEAIRPDTKLIVLIAANNETGVKTDWHAIAKVASEKGIRFVVDGVALLGKENFSIPEGVSAMVFSGHKVHAPKGVGFSLIRRDFLIDPLFTGGAQEYGKRCGTENLQGIVALGEAVRLLEEELPEATERMQCLRDRFEAALKEKMDVHVNGEGPRIANTSNLYFPGVDGEALVMALDLDGVAASLGSACSSGALEPSRILLNMGLSSEIARSSLRFSLSRFTEVWEVDQAVEKIVKRCAS